MAILNWFQSQRRKFGSFQGSSHCVNLLALAFLVAGCSNEHSSDLNCTATCLQNSKENYVLKSFDWKLDHGMAFINKVGVKKVARRPSLFAKREGKIWVSRYGNITFTQVAQDFPFGGMNNQGLVVEVLWLDSTEYPKSPKTENIHLNEVNQFQWIQYQLDMAANLKEAEENARRMLTVIDAGAKVHYLVCDKTGSCGVFEYLDGQLTITHGGNVRTLSNNEVADNLSYRRKEVTDEAKKGSSLERFAVADAYAASFVSTNKKVDVERVFDEFFPKVWRKDRTRWNIMYDPKNLKIYFRTSKNLNVIKEIDTSHKALDYSCLSDSMMLDMNEEATHPNQAKGFHIENVTLDFDWFDDKAHMKLIEEGLKATDDNFAKKFFTKRILNKYPETFTKCLLDPQPELTVPPKLVRSLASPPFIYSTCCVCDEAYKFDKEYGLDPHIGDEVGIYPAAYGSSANQKCAAYNETFNWRDKSAKIYYTRSNCRLKPVWGQTCESDEKMRQVWDDKLNEWQDVKM